MDFQQANFMSSPYCFYPYNFYQASLLNSGFNFFILPQNGKNNLELNNVSMPSDCYTPPYALSSCDSNQYSPKRTQNMVIQRTFRKQEETDGKKRSLKMNEESPKRRVTHIQKQNRNVASNLLRIFFKNILEVNVYEDFIERIIKKYKIEHQV